MIVDFLRNFAFNAGFGGIAMWIEACLRLCVRLCLRQFEANYRVSVASGQAFQSHAQLCLGPSAFALLSQLLWHSLHIFGSHGILSNNSVNFISFE